MQFERILVRAANWIGDAVMSIPALAALRAAFPAARISILARPWVGDLYGREPFCDELIPYQASKGWSSLVAKWNTARRLTDRRFDCAILLQNAFEAAAIARIADVPVRIGYDRDTRGWLLTHPVPVPKKGEIPEHQRFYYLELLKRAAIIPSYKVDEPIRLAGAAAAAAKGREHLHHAGIFGSVVGVSPGAAFGGAKRWLPGRFAQAAAAIASELGATVAIFGSSQEMDVCAEVASALKLRAVNFAGRTPLSQLIEMTAACDAFLTNDSGPMHIACSLGVPTVTVFGATNHLATGPTGENSRIVIEPADCTPCMLRECPIDHRCMTNVKAERVAEEALQLVRIHSGK